MAVLPIRLFPDPILRNAAKRVDPRSLAVKRLSQNLVDTMRVQPSGIGIAAPQIGESLQVIVIDVSSRDPRKHQLIMVNPTIEDSRGSIASREGCMSLPDYTATVGRFPRVLVAWYDLRGVRHRRWTVGIEAICVQHELDHLSGALFIDRVGSLKTDVFARRRT